MSKKKEIVVDGIKYVPEQRDADEEFRIVVVDNRGLTFVGYVNIHQPAETMATIRDARCIIRWGTKHHLAELVNGPLPNTMLGACANVQFPLRNLIVSYVCDDTDKGWRK